MSKKKLLALLMALVMTLTLVPVTALAMEVEGTGANPGNVPGPNPSIPFGNNVAQIGETKYATLAAAINAAESGDTIKVLDGTWGADAIGEYVNEEWYNTTNGNRFKSLTIEPAEGATVKFTSNIMLGYDDSSTTNASITVNNIAFENAALKIGSYVNVTVEGCTFTGAPNSSDGTLVILDTCCTTHKTDDVYPDSNVIVKNCIINVSSAGDPGIRLRNTGNVTLEGNTVENAQHNGILFEKNGSADGTSAKTIIIKDNTIKEWNAGNIKDGGRAIRLQVAATSCSVKINDNYFIKATTGLDTPDFVKIAEADNVTVDLDHNFWNGMALSEVDGHNTVYTVNGATPTVNSVITYVAQIGDNGQKYETLQEAIDAAQAGDTVTLLQDVSENVTVADNKNIVIDLAGHTINGGTVANSPAITNNGTLEIKDTVGGGVVKREDTGSSGYYVIDNAGELTVTSGTYTNGTGSTSEHAGASLIRTQETATLNIDGGTLDQQYFNVIKDEGGIVNITGGTINCSGAEYAILTYGELNISGGNINGPVDIRGYRENNVDSVGEATISGGIFNSKFYVEQYTGYHASTNPSLIIEGGQFTTDAGTFNVGEGKKPSAFTANSDYGTIVISGGIFSSEPDASYIATGYQAIDNTDEATRDAYSYTVKFKYSGQIAWNAETDKNIEIIDGMSVTNVWLMLGDKTSGFNLHDISFDSEDADAFDTIEAFYNYLLNLYLETPSIQGIMDNYEVSYLKLKYTSIVFPTVDVPAEEDVCTVDGVGYRSVKLAVDAIANSASKTGTIVMVQDYTTACAVVIPEGVNVTLDLAGHTLSAGLEATNRHVYAIENYGTFTLTDSVGTGKIEARGIENLENGTMTIDGAKIVAIDANGGAAIWNEGNLVINDGTFSTTHVGSASDAGGPACLSNQTTGTAWIKDGLFQSVNNRAYAVMNYGTMVVDNATVDGTHGGISCDTGSLTINGGSYTAKNYYGCWVTNNSSSTSVIINGGSFKGGTVGGYGLFADVDDGGQDVGNAAVLVTKGYFESGKVGAAAFAKGGKQSNNVWKLCATGGVFKGGIDASYVAEGYEAVLLSGANEYGGESEDYNGWYKVGKITATELSPESGSDDIRATYSATKVVADSEGTPLTPAETPISVTVTANQEESLTKATAKISNITAEALRDVVGNAADKAGDASAEEANVEITVAKNPVDTETTGKVTYEVHPEAIISVVGSAESTTVKLTNEQIQGTFSFKLNVSALNVQPGDSVNVTHKHGNEDENLGAFVVDSEGNITITGISSFSEFEVSVIDENEATVGYVGASLRRRVKTYGGVQSDLVVNTSTDIRFTFSWELPAGCTLSEENCKLYWSKNGNSWTAVPTFTYDSGENKASLVICNVPSSSFDTTIYVKFDLVYEDANYVQHTVTVNATPRSVYDVANGLISNLDSNVESNLKWIDYAKYLKGSYQEYYIAKNRSEGYYVVN